MSAPRDYPGCEGCRFMYRRDYGYSNYTVMGAEVECMKGVNPHMPADDENGEGYETALAFGETCAERGPGEYVWIDCDGEELDTIKADPSKIADDVRPLLWAHLGWTDGGAA